MEPAALVSSTFVKQQWFWGAAAAIVTVLLVANAALFLVVYARRLREVVRTRPTAHRPPRQPAPAPPDDRTAAVRRGRPAVAAVHDPRRGPRPDPAGDRLRDRGRPGPHPPDRLGVRDCPAGHRPARRAAADGRSDPDGGDRLRPLPAARPAAARRLGAARDVLVPAAERALARVGELPLAHRPTAGLGDDPARGRPRRTAPA